MKITILALFSLLSLAVAAEDSVYKKIEGVYFIWGDFVKEKQKDDLEGFSLFLHGNSAKRMYESMKTKAGYNECYDDGTLSKYRGNFECNKSPKGEYSCNFGVDLNTQRIYRGEAC